jgi:hypothetical protein
MPCRRAAAFALSILLPLAAVMASASRAEAQFTVETPIVKDGVRLLVTPAATIAQDENGTVFVTLTGLDARIDRTSGVVVDGKRYDYLAFNGQLVPLFNAIRVNTVALRIMFDGVGGCDQVNAGAWRVGVRESRLACTRAGTPRLTDYRLSDLTAAGILELQSKVRSLVAAEARAAQQQQQQQQQAASAAAGTARAASPSSSTAASTAASSAPAAATAKTPSPSSSTSGSASAPVSAPAPSQADAERARQQAEANRQAAEAQAVLDRLARDNEASRQRLDASMDELAGSVAQVAGLIAQNSRAKAAREARQQAQAAEYYARRVAEHNARIAARYAANLEGRVCAFSDARRVTIGQALKDSLTMSSCRTEDGRAMAWVEVENTSKRHVRVQAYGSSEFGGLNFAQAPTSAWTSGKTNAQSANGVFFLAPGAPPQRMMFYTEQRGEIGAYTVNAREWTASSVNESVWYVGLGASNGPTTVRNFGESFVGLHFEGGLHVGNGVLLAAQAGTSGSDFGNYDFGFSVQYIAGNDDHRFRPFVRLDPWHAVYGSTALPFTSEFAYDGFVYGYGVGILFFPSLQSNDVAISLEWGARSGTVSDDGGFDLKYAQQGIRLGYRAFGFGGPR